MGSQAGNGYKSTEIFLMTWWDLFVEISRFLDANYAKEEYQLSEDEVHNENFALLI